MAQLLEERVEVTRTLAPTHITEWVLGVVGVLVAAAGAYLYYAPENWVLANQVEAWHLGAFTGAGVVLAGAFGILARKMFMHEGRWSTTVVTGTLLSLAALAGAVTFALIWII